MATVRLRQQSCLSYPEGSLARTGNLAVAGNRTSARIDRHPAARARRADTGRRARRGVSPAPSRSWVPGCGCWPPGPVTRTTRTTPSRWRSRRSAPRPGGWWPPMTTARCCGSGPGGTGAWAGPRTRPRAGSPPCSASWSPAVPDEITAAQATRILDRSTPPAVTVRGPADQPCHPHGRDHPDLPLPRRRPRPLRQENNRGQDP